MDPREQLLLSVIRIVRVLRLDRMPRFIAPAYPFTDYFKGFEKVEVVKRIFGEKTEEVLGSLKVQFVSLVGYMGVSGTDGHLIVNSRYLNNGDRVDVYLDVIHELVHVRQFIEGKELFDVHYGYSDRPTEVEAYRYTVEEARRLGLSDERICDYLKTEWMSSGDLKRLAENLDVDCMRASRKEQ